MPSLTPPPGDATQQDNPSTDLTELARAMFIAISEGSAFTGIDGSGTWETATSKEAKAKWIKMASVLRREYKNGLKSADLKLHYDVRRALGMNDKCGLSGLADNVADVRRIALRLRSALQFILAFYGPGQRYLDTEAWKRAEAGARAALADAQSPRLWGDPL